MAGVTSEPVDRPGRLASSVSLLAEIADGALEPGYVAAARRRAGVPDSRLRIRPLVLLLALLAGLVAVVVVRQTHQQAPLLAKERAGLLAEVEAQTLATDRLAGELTRLGSALSAERVALLGATRTGRALAARNDALLAATGATQLTGPGLEVRLADASGAAGRARANRVYDVDLQAVVNALWAAGARGVAINGQRVTGQTAIREAGQAILVNFQPVLSPYQVLAVGNPVRLETRFGSGSTATRFRLYRQVYGLQFSYRRVSYLTLPAAPASPLFYARPVTRGKR
jgi:uncharacterized protein YlxW (UPF0749 family)